MWGSACVAAKSGNTGVFGGSFDPIHLGHLLIAQDACEAFGLDRVCFVPAAQSPLKSAAPGASDAHRLGMVAAAIEDYPQFEALDIELTSGGISYTVGTTRQLRERFPDEELYLIIGADQAAQLERWHDIETLATMAQFLVVERPGFDTQARPAHRIENLRLHHIDGHLFEISSTEIRERVAAGQHIDFLVHPRVQQYIHKHQLYR
ncbi:MAG: nicotinate-nucleotide adenylyltransferase [Opitutales bacterium]